MRDLLAWLQRDLQAMGRGIAVRVREEPVITVAWSGPSSRCSSASVSAGVASRSP